MSCQAQSVSVLISHLPCDEPPQGPLSNCLAQRAIGHTPAVFSRMQFPQAWQRSSQMSVGYRFPHKTGIDTRENYCFRERVGQGFALRHRRKATEPPRHRHRCSVSSTANSGSHCRAGGVFHNFQRLSHFLRAIFRAEASKATSFSPPAWQTVTQAPHPESRIFRTVPGIPVFHQ